MKDHAPTGPVRTRDLGIALSGVPGPLNAITDVPGVEVGCATIVLDTDSPDVAARTGVTAILPLGRARAATSVPAGIHSLNGNGELTGSHWIQETGALGGPIMITSTTAVGAVHQGSLDWMVREHPERAEEWILPVVAETWDGYLNSMNEHFITPEHAIAALDDARGGPVAEGSVGGGTGMNCYGFKGGNGTASRTIELGGVTYTVGVFVQANFGDRDELTIAGVPMADLDVPCPIETTEWISADRRRATPAGAGSVITIVATDAPLLPLQCQAMARRVSLGLARTGTAGSHFSGDIFLAFSTGNAGALDSGFPELPASEVALGVLQMVPWNRMDPFFTAVVQSTEEAVLNALVVNREMTGRSGHHSPALPHDQVRSRLHQYRRLSDQAPISSRSS